MLRPARNRFAPALLLCQIPAPERMKPSCIFAAAAVLLGAACAVAAQSPPKPSPGLMVTYTAADGRATDSTLVPNVALHVVAGQAASPFLSAGPFAAEWSGFVSADLRGDFAFAAELSGTVKVEVNGAPALEATAAAPAPGKPVRLNKGTNAFKVTYTAPKQGDAFLRLRWIPRNGFPQPIPDPLLSHLPSETVAKSAQLRLGRELFIEARCVKCHTGPAPAEAVPDLAMDAPGFEGIGSRRRFAWLAKWVTDPHAMRATARMPQVLHGPSVKQDAEAIAAFLASLKATTPPAPSPSNAALIETGQELATKLHCASCHNLPGGENDERKKIWLKHANEKFTPGALAAFLKKPDTHYAWIRMPDLKLSDPEANALAAWVGSIADKAAPAAAPSDDGLIAKGRNLVQTSGCLNCHALKLENEFKARPLDELAATQWQGGCLAAKADANSRAPRYAFDAAERTALAAFGATDRASLTRHVPAEFAEREIRILNCMECHGKLEGFPRLEHLGGKLRPEWTGSFIAGKISYKPRPWIEARMPVFAGRARLLAHGLAAQHGYPPQTPVEAAPVNSEEAGIGRKLVSAEGGFSCVACHAAGEFGATQVFESAGVNLALSHERLLRPYYTRWLLNPTLTDPSTKMPVYFSDYPQSPLPDVLGGEAEKQIGAIWEYLRLGWQMPPPTEGQ
jgi:mono/diheme cytochrome c family protein